MCGRCPGTGVLDPNLLVARCSILLAALRIVSHWPAKDASGGNIAPPVISNPPATAGMKWTSRR
jgi:hypothetical protein